MSEKALRNGEKHGVLVPEAVQPGTLGALALEQMQERWRTEAIGANWSVAVKAKWKFRFSPLIGHCFGTAIAKRAGTDFVLVPEYHFGSHPLVDDLRSISQCSPFIERRSGLVDDRASDSVPFHCGCRRRGESH